MTDQELEQRLADAVTRAAPDDVAGVLSRCGTQTGNVIPIAQTAPRRTRRWAPLAIAACLVLAAAGGGAGYLHHLNSAVASIVCLDVNPSVELTVNRNETVLSATPTNADAEVILGGMDLTGAKVDVAMNAIVGSLLTNGYVDELANSILITVEDDDAQRGARLQQELTAQADAILSSYQVNGAILSQTIQNSAQLQQLAADYGISAGKAALIQTIVDGSGGTKTFQDLVGLSINELNLIYSSLSSEGQSSVPSAPGGTGGGNAAAPIQSSGQANDSTYIGMEAAKAAALTHAGVSAADATFLEAEYDWDYGRMVYEVEFRAGGREYEYEIDALTGEVVQYQSEGDGAPAQSGGQSGGVNTGSFIGEAAAKAAALADAGVQESDTTYCNAWLDYDDGQPECYEVEFMAGSTRYEYKIALTSATVLEQERESYGRPSGGGSAGSGTSGESSAGGSSTGGGTVSSSDIGAEAAKAAALTHAGVSESDAYQMKVERDYDDGRLEYEVEFKAGGMEYEYTVNASDGSILSFESDRDD